VAGRQRLIELGGAARQGGADFLPGRRQAVEYEGPRLPVQVRASSICPSRSNRWLMCRQSSPTEKQAVDAVGRAADGAAFLSRFNSSKNSSALSTASLDDSPACSCGPGRSSAGQAGARVPSQRFRSAPQAPRPR